MTTHDYRATVSAAGASTSDLTLAKLRETIKSMPVYDERDIFPFGKPFSLGPFNMRVFEIDADIRPVLRIRDEVPCTDEVRREVNEWLLEMFGTRDHSLFARGRAILWNGNMALRKEDMVLLTNLT